MIGPAGPAPGIHRASGDHVTRRRRLTRGSIAAGCLMLLILAPAALGPYWETVAIDFLIFSLFAMSLSLLVGYAGLPSLGHSVFMGSGAYAVALSITTYRIDPLVALGIGVLFATGVGLATGWVAIRTKGAYFLMITLGLAEILRAVAIGWRSFTGGDDGVPGVVRPELPLGLDLNDRAAFYYFVLLVVVVCIAGICVLKRSHYGLALRGLATSERRMRVLGYNVAFYQYSVFVLAGAFAGVAGALVALHRGFVSPVLLSVGPSAEALLMVILGGSGTVLGPIVGAFIVVTASNLVSGWTGRWLLILGALYVIVVWLIPRGVVGSMKSVRSGQ